MCAVSSKGIHPSGKDPGAAHSAALRRISLDTGPAAVGCSKETEVARGSPALGTPVHMVCPAPPCDVPSQVKGDTVVSTMLVGSRAMVKSAQGSLSRVGSTAMPVVKLPLKLWFRSEAPLEQTVPEGQALAHGPMVRVAQHQDGGPQSGLGFGALSCAPGYAGRTPRKRRRTAQGGVQGGYFPRASVVAALGGLATQRSSDTGASAASDGRS